MQIRLCHSPAWNCPGLQTKALGESHGPSRFAPSGFFSVTHAAPSLHFSLGSDPAALCSSNMSCFLSLLAFEPKTSLCWDLPLSLLSCSWKDTPPIACPDLVRKDCMAQISPPSEPQNLLYNCFQVHIHALEAVGDHFSDPVQHLDTGALQRVFVGWCFVIRHTDESNSMNRPPESKPSSHP